MVWAALLYAIVGTWLTHKIGKPLIGLEFDQQRVEADYRFSLVRLRENSEGVALYRGETEELGLRERFANVITNWWKHHAQAEAARLLHDRSTTSSPSSFPWWSPRHGISRARSRSAA